ncbi:YfhO family protein [Fulvivirga sediminis]|uniref:YfhO family protein n=1 Tax=Fulvivirga sediminis TaxID=2803949 RepID=A0A937K0A7_9BACT|nr:YfhO family protein [Fulvivirga sediminis]MBL3657474.1 YfhO family protein [Fulvivirga sediminis]
MKIDFKKQVIPHIVALLTFLLITVLFFNPIFFDGKKLAQEDINQWRGGAQELEQYREKTGEEGLWNNSQFGGMPAYLVNVRWSDSIVSGIKSVLSFGLPHPVKNIFLSFLCFYILLLAFKVRPYLAIGGALAFGLSSYMLIGLGAGHNARIGAIAFMPLIIAGIHIAFTRNKILGFGLTAVAVALELRESHPQITYYLLMILGVYGVLQLIAFIKSKRAKDFAITSALLVIAALLALGTSFGRMWSIYEFSKYSQRGKSELSKSISDQENTEGLSKDYAFKYSNGILEPLVMMIPDFYGGSSGHLLVQDEDSKVLAALQKSRDPQTANQLARYTSAYWGNQPYTAPYYAGAVICLLFAIGIAFADKKYVIWLVIVAALGIILSWGDNFKALNYFFFDYLPGYNKFRSVTFTIIMPLLAMPLLGFIGLEKLLAKGLNKETQKKLFIALGATGGFCLLVVMFAGMASFTKTGEHQLPAWFLKALQDDRKSLMRGDALRSLVFILIGFGLIFFNLKNKLSFGIMAGVLSLITLVDLWNVDRRYFDDGNFKRERDNSFFSMTEADKEILKDKGLSYRVYNPQGTFMDARTSYHHKSLGGYNGARIRRYEELFNGCIQEETSQLISSLQSGSRSVSGYGVLNMLNTKYIVFGPAKNAVLKNNEALGNAWFVESIKKVNSADEEFDSTCEINPAKEAVIDISKFTPAEAGYDASASITLSEYKPNELVYESNSSKDGLAVFSEVYYPIGWTATIDGKEVDIMRANFVLRALNVPAGKHTITFKFEPKAYTVGDSVTLASCIILLLVFLGSIGWTIKQEKVAS